MNDNADRSGHNFGPQLHKTFPIALEAFFASECPQIGGRRTRQVLVQSILGLVEQFFPSTTNLKTGQTVWTCIHKDENPGYGKRIRDTRLTSVILDLVPPQEIAARAHGVPLRELKVAACARLFDQAYAQNGVLTSAEVALLLRLSPWMVGTYVREYEQAHHRRLPRRGIIHDMGPTLTHKREILAKLVFDGLSVEEVCRQTDHSPEAVLRYALNFKQVLLCRRKKLTNAEIVYATRLSRRLVEEYQGLIEEYARKHPRWEFDGQPELEALLDKLEANAKVSP